MASFSLEFDGLLGSQVPGLSDDPFINAGISQSQVGHEVVLDPQYSDISDDDFQIPSSQKHLGERSVNFKIIF